MSMFDFSNETNQQEFSPIPSGSIVIVAMNVLQPKYPAHDNAFISVTKNGLRQLYSEFTVADGTYAGVSWRQMLTLPLGMQNGANLTEGQKKACRIGGATLKAILQAGRRSLNVADLSAFNGIHFPVKVKINSEPRISKAGNEYWVNEIATVVTPDKPEYQDVRQMRELINTDGAVVGTPKEDKPRAGGSGSGSEDRCHDEVPF